MSNAISTLMMIALMLATVSFLAQGSFTAMAQLSDAWTAREERRIVDSRTSITSNGVSYATPSVDVTVRNDGAESVRGFSKWDVVVQYYETDGTFHSKWVPYTSATTPGDDQYAGRRGTAALVRSDPEERSVHGPWGIAGAQRTR